MTTSTLVSRSVSNLRDLSDACLVERCLARNNAAWDALEGRHAAGLLHFIEGLLAPWVVDRVRTAEDVQQDTWVALVKRDFHCLRDWQRHRRLFPFLCAVGSEQTALFHRQQRRQLRAIAFSQLPGQEEVLEVDLPMMALVNDFLSTLAPDVRRYVLEYQRPLPPGSWLASLSDTYRWQLRYRARQAWFAYLYGL